MQVQEHLEHFSVPRAGPEAMDEGMLNVRFRA